MARHDPIEDFEKQFQQAKEERREVARLGEEPLPHPIFGDLDHPDAPTDGIDQREAESSDQDGMPGVPPSPEQQVADAAKTIKWVGPSPRN